MSTRLTFVLADTWRTHMGVTHENQFVPFKRRTVTITLTAEQEAAIGRRCVGSGNGVDQYEELLDCFVEHDPPALP